MLFFLIGSFVVIIFSILLHSTVIRYLKKQYQNNQSVKTYVTVTFILLASHVLQVMLFALLYYYAALLNPIVGSFKGINSFQFLDVFYYSFNCYTTLGMGDIYATGSIRITAVMESLIGLIMIAWSATLILSILIKKE